MNPLAWLDLERARRLALPVGAAVVVVAVVIAAAWAWHRSQEAQGEAAMAAAMPLVQQAHGSQATPEARAKAIQALEGVLKDHGRFSGAGEVAYLLANLRYTAGEPKPARAAYEVALAKTDSPTLRALATLGIGYTWEAEKDYAKAASAYETAVKQMGAKDFLYEDALAALGRVQGLAGQPDAAQQTYQRLLKEVPDTRRADDLKTRLADLKSQPAK